MAAILTPLQHQDPIDIIDLSDFRPENKSADQFRNYFNSDFHQRVAKVYTEMHTKQTVQFVQQRMKHWCEFSHARMPMMQAIKSLDALVDESDPDVDLPNSVHAFQTAERIREKYPHLDWFILTGLIHDAGKLMRLFGEEMWATVGDTYPVGCQPRQSIVFGVESFADNPDLQHPVYGTSYGIYHGNCGLDALTMSWGHDEYLYRVLQHNGHTLPEAALSIIRYHSFYPWHTCSDYREFHQSPIDDEKLKWVLAFNQFDLYSKSDQVPDAESLMPYYQALIDKYLPPCLSW